MVPDQRDPAVVLLAPSAIARIVLAKKPDLDPTDVNDFVEQAYEGAIEYLKEATFDRVSTRYRYETVRKEERNVEVAEAN